MACLVPRRLPAAVPLAAQTPVFQPALAAGVRPAPRSPTACAHASTTTPVPRPRRASLCATLRHFALGLYARPLQDMAPRGSLGSSRPKAPWPRSPRTPAVLGHGKRAFTRIHFSVNVHHPSLAGPHRPCTNSPIGAAFALPLDSAPTLMRRGLRTAPLACGPCLGGCIADASESLSALAARHLCACRAPAGILASTCCYLSAEMVAACTGLILTPGPMVVETTTLLT